MKVFINSSEVPKSNYSTNSVTVNKKASYLGKISSNQGSIKLINNGNYTLTDYYNKPVIIKDDDDNAIFTGVTCKVKTQWKKQM